MIICRCCIILAVESHMGTAHVEMIGLWLFETMVVLQILRMVALAIVTCKMGWSKLMSNLDGAWLAMCSIVCSDFCNRTYAVSVVL
ncbi:MAG: hypothetical protein NZ805_07290 [Armatimonadetes bacterium]|nr:hypothetical protein [Armatimonadota bacterium]MDW8028324.1 hypothetical protein [Armatimonadota bacterium]